MWAFEIASRSKARLKGAVRQHLEQDRTLLGDNKHVEHIIEAIGHTIDAFPEAATSTGRLLKIRSHGCISRTGHSQVHVSIETFQPVPILDDFPALEEVPNTA